MNKKEEGLEPVGLLVIGDLPKTCKACPLLYTDQGWGFDFCVFQQWSDEEITLDYYDKLDKEGKRPSWCPLTKDLAILSARVFGRLKISEIVERKKK